MSPPGGPWLVTGASGFLGRAVLERARACADLPEALTAGRGPGCQVALDLAAPAPTLPRGLHTVLHIAGEKRDPAQMEAINHHGTRRLAEAAAAAGVARFVHVSSVGVYGAAPHSGTVDEAFAHTPRNAYEASKEAGEAAVREVGRRTGMATVILQPSNVIGVVPGVAYPLRGLMRLIGRGAFAWFGRGTPWVNYVAVEDVAAAVLAAVRGAPAGTYIVNTPAPLREAVRWISEELGVAVPRRTLPLWAGAAAAAAGSAIERLCGRSMPLQRARLLELTNTTRYDPSHFMKTLSFEYPLGAEALLRGLAGRYRREGLL